MKYIIKYILLLLKTYQLNTILNINSKIKYN